ncbi:MAG: hypothetical protein ACKO7B_01600, partial [Flavobacteriales bacterium]
MAISRWAALLAAVVALFASSQAKAQIVGTVIQGQFSPLFIFNPPGFQTTSGGVLSTAGATWNRIWAPQTVDGTGPMYPDNDPLRSATNVSLRGVSFSASLANVGGQGVNVVGSPNFNGFSTTSSFSLMNNYAYSTATSSGQNTFSFSGLANGTYNFYAYTSGDVASNGRNLAMQIG